MSGGTHRLLYLLTKIVKRLYEEWLEAVREGECALMFVPEEMCLDVVQRDGYMLCAVPEERRTYEMCLAAVKKNYRAFRYVSEEIEEAYPDLYQTARYEELEET